MKIYTDGASRGNPGKAAAAFVVINDSNKIIKKKSKYIGIKTNNEAEYLAIIMALQEIKGNLTITSDSQLVIKQLRGEYKINKPHLQELANKVNKLVENKQVIFKHVKRDNKYIAIADQLVNQVLDKKLK
ncbi:MAG: ribonuclease HI family protein [Candidatus Nanoarchaeia archaeon]